MLFGAGAGRGRDRLRTRADRGIGRHAGGHQLVAAGKRQAGQHRNRDPQPLDAILHYAAPRSGKRHSARSKISNAKGSAIRMAGPPLSSMTPRTRTARPAKDFHRNSGF